MKYLPNACTRHLFLLCFIVFFNHPSTRAQTDAQALKYIYYIGERPNYYTFDCSEIQQPGCNLIQNNNFTSSSPNSYIFGMPEYHEAFNLGLIDKWGPAPGSANVADLFADLYGGPQPMPPAPATGFAFMAAWYEPTSDQLYSEGVAQKITKLTPGKKYSFSYFRRRAYLSSPMEHFYIVLMKCTDHHLIYPNENAHETPPFPANSQTVYCEDNILASSWQQVAFTFTPNDSYDMIWIVPVSHWLAGIDFAYPQLIKNQDFIAGSPIPTANQCEVLLGSQANCTVSNAIYTWNGPHGQTYYPFTPQLQINTADPNNVGNWTLTMTVPSAYVPPSNTCSVPFQVSSSTYVSGCYETWPKVYSYGRLPGVLLKDNNGNFLTSFLAMDMDMQINHVGPLPPPPATSSIDVDFHYDQTGVTNWYRVSPYHGNQDPVFVLTNGTVQYADYTYTDITTGNAASAPGNVPNGEMIIAETNTGQYITRDGTNIYVHTGATTTLVTDPGGQSKFNSNSNKLYLIKYDGSVGNYEFMIYTLLGNAFGAPVINTINETYFDLFFAQIDNQDNVYVVKNNIFQQYDVLSNSFMPVSNIQGFSILDNFDIYGFATSHPYTDDQCLIVNKTQNKIYALDLTTPQSKKTDVVNFPYSVLTPDYQTVKGLYYVFDGSILYLAGWTTYNIPGNDLVISNQTIPVLGPLDHSVFFTKFNLETTFSRESGAFFSKNTPATPPRIMENNTEGFKTIISPNPANDFLKIGFVEKNSTDPKTYNISIINSNGVVVHKQFSYQKNLSINISKLSRGVYYLLAVNSKGERSVSIFLKQ